MSRRARAQRLAAAAAAVVLVAAAPAAHADESVIDRTIQDERILESSGLAASALHDGVLYTHNDSDYGPEVYAVGPDGETEAVLTLRGAEARDWEAVSPGVNGESELWIGDIGDNLSTWPTVRVYRVEEPTVLTTQDVEWTQYDLDYEDGPRDAEALLVHPRTGRLHVVSKEFGNAGLYRAPKRLRADRTNTLVRVADAPSGVTDGAFSPDGSHYVLRGYAGATLFATDEPDVEVRRIDLPPQRQGESLAWSRDGGALYVGSEGRRSDIHRVELLGGGDDGPVVGEDPLAGDAPAVLPDGDGGDPAGSDARTQLLWLALGAGLLVVLGLGMRAWARHD